MDVWNGGHVMGSCWELARACVHMRSPVSPRAWKSLYHRVGSNPSTMRSCGERSTCGDGRVWVAR